MAVAHILSDKNFKTVTTFLPLNANAKKRIRVTRKRYRRGTTDEIDLVVTIGRPNYAEREFLKDCKKTKSRPREYWTKSFRTK